MAKPYAAITGVSAWAPDYVLNNAELERMVETNDEWIQTRTGVKERRILREKGKGTSDLAMPAVQDLLKKTNTDPSEIDLIICATTTPDMLFPATANIIADKAGITNSWGFDLNAACSGFIYALDTGARFIESARCKKVIVIGADKMSSIVNYTDRTTCVIFGDGAGAVLLEPDTQGYGIRDSILHSEGSGRHYLHQKAGGSVKPPSPETLAAEEHFIYQEGKQVFKFAVTKMADVSYEIMKKNKLEPEDIAWLVPHQANKRIIDATANRMGLDAKKVMINIQRYGNTTNGTIPLCLGEWEDRLNKGDNIIISAFGGGFTWGSLYVKWAYDGSEASKR